MKVIWKSEERVIPGYGVGTPGKEIELPDALAEGFIRQGDAVKQPKTRKADEVQS